MNREPSLEEWFGIFVCNRAEAKNAISAVTDETKYEHQENYELIIEHADRQLRGLCMRMRKLSYFASKHKAEIEQNKPENKS